jgi:D-3-phosphoglycerate dehydrogenase
LADEALVERRPTAAHPLTAAQLRAEIGDADALIVGLDEVDESVFAAAERLRVVAKHGVGVDNIDCAAARRHGVRVVNALGTNTGAVADLTMALLLSAVRRIVPTHASVHDGRWDRFFGPELGALKLGAFGFGKIGQAVARRARGFGMHVRAFDPYVPEQVFAELGAEAVDFDTCLPQSDALTLHLPTTGEQPLLGAAELARTKPGAYLVNTARGGLIDEHALAELLRSGHLGGAAVDVYATEPPHGSPLLDAPNLIATPHMAAFTDQANAEMGVAVVRDVARVLRADDPVNAVV